MTLGFYDHNEGISYPFIEPADDTVAGVPLQQVIVGAAFSLSTAFGPVSQSVRLTNVVRSGIQRITFTVAAGADVVFQFDVNYTAAGLPRYSAIRANAIYQGSESPSIGTGTLVINSLRDLITLPIAADNLVDIEFEPSTVHLAGDTRVTSVRLANKKRTIDLQLHDDPIPAGTPTELVPSRLSAVSEDPAIEFCSVGGDELLSLEYNVVETSSNPPVLVDIVSGDTYEAEDDTARSNSGFIDVTTEVATFTSALAFTEGYNMSFLVTASVPRLQLNLVPGAGEGVGGLQAAGDCNGAARSFFGAVPNSEGSVTIQTGPGVTLIPEPGAHRLTLSLFEPNAAGVQSCG